MRTTRTLLLILTLAGFATTLAPSCATRPSAASCSEYTPSAPCSPGFTMACEVTRDGCEQCGCVPTGDEGGRSPYLSPR